MVKLYPKMELLKKDELRILVAKGEASSGGKALTPKDVKDCIPITDELKGL